MITGAYTQSSGGTLTIEIGGYTGGTDFDQLSVGAATLAGTLAVHLTGGFMPALGDAFEIMRFGSRSGDFGTNTGLVVSTRIGFRKTYSPTTLTLQFGQEICDDGQDNDGDGLADCADPKCADFLSCTFTPTTTGTATATPTPTPTAPATPSATLAPPSTTPSASPTATPTPQAECVGDCNHNSIVTIDELIRGVNIALGTLALDACPEFDSNHDGSVTINELISAVNNALNGCPGAATPADVRGVTSGAPATAADRAAGAPASSAGRCRARAWAWRSPRAPAPAAG